MNEALNEVTLSQLVELCPQFRPEERVEGFTIAKLVLDEKNRIFHYPFRFDGYMAIYCVEGEFSVDINLNTYHLREGMLLLYEPGNIVKLQPEDRKPVPAARFYVTAISRAFLQDVDRDISRFYSNSVAVHEDPFLVFTGSDAETMTKFYELTENIYHLNIPDRQDTLLTLAASAIFFLRSFWIRKQQEMLTAVRSHSARAHGMVDAFIRLVTEHHLTEHYLSFYAKELDITPKYLSKLVRDVTGRSAPDWIDSFLVLEAKNMLKYSDMAIKEVVFKLHFPDQSSFYKFFKLHTGMIPSEYRKMQ